ncbi:MAG: hypothetical protein KGY75_08835, partial [Candidatus Cloacimonetes bacterium]|nr:hypothetical protein [Candidatus Cloacimonadota bacterium]
MRKNILLFALAGILLVLIFNLLFSAIGTKELIIVDIEGAGHYTTIQAGIDAASTGDTVLVYPGTYYENINFNGKNIILCSKYMLNNDASYIDSTIIDGNHNGSVVTFENGEDTTAVLSGFTIQHGSGTYHSFLVLGGGILLIDSQATIQDCIVRDNTSQGGGGIGLYYSFINIENTTIYNNHAIFWGGGIGIYYSDIDFSSTKRCNIYLNYAGEGCDLRTIQSNDIQVFVDTFTVAEPDNYFVFPLDSFSFDIENHKIEQTNNDLYVDPNGNNHNSGLSPNEPLKTISWALTKIKSDSTKQNTIYLSSGKYSPITTEEKFALNCKSYVSIIGESKHNTYLDGENQFFILHSRDDSCYSIDNITIQNGINEITGGGALVYYSYDFRFRDVNFIDNQADVGGGAIYMRGTEGIFDNVLIKGNSSDGGGGLGISGNSNPVFIDCVIDSNYTLTPGWGFAGGISNNVESNSIFINCKITNNISSECSGMSVSGGAGDYCDPMLINCTLSGNSDNPYGTISQGDNSNVSLINCILRNPSEHEIVFSSSAPPETVMVSYCNVDGGIDAIDTNNNGTIFWGEGNIDQDPLFVGGDPFSYQLSEDSPCIDAGTPDTTGLNLPATDLAGNPRIYNGRVDIGAYEY